MTQSKSNAGACIKIEKGLCKRHAKKVNELIDKFFSYLGKAPQKTEEEVRNKFTRLQTEWIAYCAFNKLETRTSMLFNAKVSYEWEMLMKESSK